MQKVPFFKPPPPPEDAFERFRWLGPLFDRLDRLSDKLELHIIDIYDCGALGCAFRTQEGPVVKVTSDEAEARVWDQIRLEKETAPQEMRGFADVYRPVAEMTLTGWPFSKQIPLHVIVREPLDNIRDMPENLVGMMNWMGTFAQIGRIDELNRTMMRMQDDYPVMLPAIQSIAHLANSRKILVWDLHPDNLGTRPEEPYYILRDPSMPHLPNRRWRAKKRFTI